MAAIAALHTASTATIHIHRNLAGGKQWTTFAIRLALVAGVR